MIITAASEHGMLKMHDQRPQKPEHAHEWLDLELLPKRAEEIAKYCCRPVDDFEWFPVDKAVGNVRNQGPQLIQKKLPS